LLTTENTPPGIFTEIRKQNLFIQESTFCFGLTTLSQTVKVNCPQFLPKQEKEKKK